MDGPDWIRFSVAKPYWNELATYLDPPSFNHLNNWEGLAAELEFKMREIEHIKHIKHPSGSNTIIMFEQYVRNNNGGDFDQVVRALDKLKSREAEALLRNKYEDIKARNMREYGPEPMASTPPQAQFQHDIIRQQREYGPEPMASTPPQAQPQQDIFRQQQQQIQELQRQNLQQQQQLYQQHSLRPPAPQVPLDQARYMPMPEQIPQHLWPQLWIQMQAVQRMQAQQHPHQVQETPMNLKKRSPPLNAPINLYQNFNRQTDKDFPIGFGDQFKPHSPDSNTSLEPQMDSLRSMNQSWGVQSMQFSGPKEYPAEFTEVLGRGENKVASLTPEPMVIAPIPDRPSKSTPTGSHRPDLMDFSTSDSNGLGRSDVRFPVHPSPTQTMPTQQHPSFRHLSDESYLSRPQACYTRLSSGGLVKDTYPLVSQAPPSIIPHGAFPLGNIPIKQEKTEDAKPMEVAHAFPDDLRAGVTPQLLHQQRQSVIQAGPQCNSLPSASPGDISQMSSPGTVKDEEDTDQRAHSLEERPTQQLYGKHLRPKRYTWPMTNKELKETQEPPKPEPPKPLPLGEQAQSFSVDRNYKQPPFKKKPVKVLMTYTMGPKDTKNHKKELTVLYNCLVKNDFRPSLDFKEEQTFNRNMQGWIDTRFREANFVIVCISPQYKKDVAHHDEMEMPQNRYSSCCRYIHNLMQNEFVHQGSHNKRFLPVLFPGSSTDDIPMWMRSIVPFRWREHWRDIMYMMLEPKDIIVKIKGNKERFTEQQKAPIIRMTQSCS